MISVLTISGAVAYGTVPALIDKLNTLKQMFKQQDMSAQSFLLPVFYELGEAAGSLDLRGISE